jgi:tetratricopeptide (TPR) repeat protein
MHASPFLLYAALALGLGAAPAPPPKPERLVAQLGAQDWHEREAAAVRLLAVGEAAVPALQRALDHPDLEVRYRARALLARLRWKAPDRLSETLAGAWEQYDFLPENQRLMLLSRITAELRKDAVAILRRVLKHDPSPMVRRQALMHIMGQDRNAAEGDLRALAAQDEADAWAITQLGQLLAGRGEVDAAIKVYEAARQKDPKNSRLSMALAQLYERKGRWHIAGKLYAELVKTEPEGVRRYGVKVGHCFYKAGETEQAEAAWAEMIRALGDGPDAYTLLSRAYEGVGAKEKALDALRQGAQKHPRDFEILRNLGRKLADAGQNEDAVAVLERAHRLVPSNYQSRMVNADLVRVLRATNRLEAFLKEREAALERLDAALAADFRKLAERHLAAGRRDAARQALERLVTLYADRDEGRWAAEALRKLGRED